MNWNSLAGRSFGIVGVAVACVGLLGCKPSSTEGQRAGAPEQVRGTPIAAPVNGSNTSPKATFVPADFSKPDEVRDGVIQLGWGKLSGFKFDVHEVFSESQSGRPLLRSDDTIPAPVKAYHGKRVSISGFLLPLRTRKGQVTEFLLLRDQGACCFGPRAQINHFIRVKFSGGIQPSEPVPWQVSGVLHVAEIYIQGYLTGIYELEAETARESQKR